MLFHHFRSFILALHSVFFDWQLYLDFCFLQFLRFSIQAWLISYRCRRDDGLLIVHSCGLSNSGSLFYVWVSRFTIAGMNPGE